MTWAASWPEGWQDRKDSPPEEWASEKELGRGWSQVSPGMAMLLTQQPASLRLSRPETPHFIGCEPSVRDVSLTLRYEAPPGASRGR